MFVGGDTAEDIDYYDVMDSWLPIVLVFVLGLSFVLLTIAFRSIVVPATAIAMNLLSVGAAYGLLVLVFVEGVGNELFGFQQVDTIEAWVPLFLFAVLFGLSMDYQVFLLSRIRERYSQTGDNDDAVSFGVGSTARLITGAALIIIAVFAGFARGDLVMFQQMGFGIAVALLHRRHDHPLGRRAGDDDAPRPLELVPAVLARAGFPTSTSRATRRSSSRAALPDVRRCRARALGGGGVRRERSRGPHSRESILVARTWRPTPSGRRNRPWHDWTVILLLLPAILAAVWICVGGLVTGVERVRRGAARPGAVGPRSRADGPPLPLISYHGRHPPVGAASRSRVGCGSGGAAGSWRRRRGSSRPSRPRRPSG